jgi:hypothetical protein
MKPVSFTFTDGNTGESIESKGSQNCEELHRLINPNSRLITTLPSGIGLDFEAQEGGKLWIEFYADEPSGAFITMEVAEEVVRRAFTEGDGEIKKKYADLISEWEF